MIITKDRNTYKTVSRWIQLKYKRITKNSKFWDYADKYSEDEEGYRWIYTFAHKGKTYCLEQFSRMSFPVIAETDDENILISGYEVENYHDPLLLEVHANGEAVRLWKDV